MTAWSCQHPSLAGERCVLEPRAIVTGTFRRENVPKTADTQMAFRSLFQRVCLWKGSPLRRTQDVAEDRMAEPVR
jgi:hypothetical protein